MTTAQTSSLLRAKLKAAGIPARAVSVRSEDYSMGASINVTIKSAAVSLAQVTEIAESFQSIRRDSRGEVLNGGNLYVHVKQSAEVRAELRASASAALAELAAAGPAALECAI